MAETSYLQSQLTRKKNKGLVKPQIDFDTPFSTLPSEFDIPDSSFARNSLRQSFNYSIISSGLESLYAPSSNNIGELATEEEKQSLGLNITEDITMERALYLKEVKDYKDAVDNVSEYFGGNRSTFENLSQYWGPHIVGGMAFSGALLLGVASSAIVGRALTGGIFGVGATKLSNALLKTSLADKTLGGFIAGAGPAALMFGIPDVIENEYIRRREVELGRGFNPLLASAIALFLPSLLGGIGGARQLKSMNIQIAAKKELSSEIDGLVDPFLEGLNIKNKSVDEQISILKSKGFKEEADALTVKKLMLEEEGFTPEQISLLKRSGLDDGFDSRGIEVDKAILTHERPFELVNSKYFNKDEISLHFAETFSKVKRYITSLSNPQMANPVHSYLVLKQLNGMAVKLVTEARVLTPALRKTLVAKHMSEVTNLITELKTKLSINKSTKELLVEATTIGDELAHLSRVFKEGLEETDPKAIAYFNSGVDRFVQLTGASNTLREIFEYVAVSQLKNGKAVNLTDFVSDIYRVITDVDFMENFLLTHYPERVVQLRKDFFIDGVYDPRILDEIGRTGLFRLIGEADAQDLLKMTKHFGGSRTIPERSISLANPEVMAKSPIRPFTGAGVIPPLERPLLTGRRAVAPKDIIELPGKALGSPDAIPLAGKAGKVSGNVPSFADEIIEIADVSILRNKGTILSLEKLVKSYKVILKDKSKSTKFINKSKKDLEGYKTRLATAKKEFKEATKVKETLEKLQSQKEYKIPKKDLADVERLADELAEIGSASLSPKDIYAYKTILGYLVNRHASKFGVPNVAVEFSSRINTKNLGQAEYRPRAEQQLTVRLNSFLIGALPPSRLHQLIIHELTHISLLPNHPKPSHGKEFVQQFRNIGGTDANFEGATAVLTQAERFRLAKIRVSADMVAARKTKGPSIVPETFSGPSPAARGKLKELLEVAGVDIDDIANISPHLRRQFKDIIDMVDVLDKVKKCAGG